MKLLKWILTSFSILNIFSLRPFSKNRFTKDKLVVLDTSELPLSKISTLEKCSGFFGMIGPNIKKMEVKTLFDLFVGDGIINGIYFDKGKLVYVQHLIQTEKVKHESRFGRYTGNWIFMGISMLLHKLGLIPNPMGVANTAIMKSSNRVFAMFERDSPYEIYLDHQNQQILTLGKIKTPAVTTFSGHSRFEKNRIKTLDYKILEKLVLYREFDDEFILKKSKNFPTTYLPIVHDFITSEINTILFADSPFVYSNNIKKPVSFDKRGKTIFHIEKRNIRYIIPTNESFYIFHYGTFRENTTSIEFFAAMYYDIDFSDINICGKYRKISICLKTGNVEIEMNPELETYNLDFPVNYGKYTILRNLDMSNKKINGFLICDGLHICDSLFFENRNICGEPVVVETTTGGKHICCFAYENDEHYLMMYRLLDDGKFDRDGIEIKIPEKIGIGFHSTYLKNE
jgi:hypothetical protein